jgi:hypothetical protein
MFESILATEEEHAEDMQNLLGHLGATAPAATTTTAPRTENNNKREQATPRS